LCPDNKEPDPHRQCWCGTSGRTEVSYPEGVAYDGEWWQEPSARVLAPVSQGMAMVLVDNMVLGMA